MLNFFKKLESPIKTDEAEGTIVDTSYHNNLENVEKVDYTSLLNENNVEWKREDVEEAKNKFELVKDQLPEDFNSKSYEERIQIANQIIEMLK